MPDGVLPLLAPELMLIATATIVLLLGIGRSSSWQTLVAPISALGVLASLALASYSLPPDDAPYWSGLRPTHLTSYIRVIALGIGMLALLMHMHLPRPAERGDLFAMILFSLAGILLTSMADELILLFLAVELVSVPAYVLVSIGRSDIRAQEAGVKYFFLGAMAAALLAYGFSFLYGATGTTVLHEMEFNATRGAYVTWGLLLAFAGVAFKIAAVPFHVYAADVYQGAASPVTGLLGFFPKLAGFVVLIKLIALIQPAGAVFNGWNLPDPGFWFIWLIAAATMTVGNVLGLMQTNIKRMLGYSSIAHTGYMLVGLLVGPVSVGGPLRNGLSAMLFYIVVYGVMNLGAFAVLALVESRGKAAEELDDLAGLGRRHPLAALAMAICVFGLMGMPPTAGFFGKLYLFTGALSTGADHPHRMAMLALAIIGVINSAIAAAYYLRIVATCYLREPPAELKLIPRHGALRLGLAGCCLAVIGLGVFPGGLLNMARFAQHRIFAPHIPDTRVERLNQPADRMPLTAVSALLEGIGSPVELVQMADKPQAGGG